MSAPLTMKIGYIRDMIMGTLNLRSDLMLSRFGE
jgi:hypothetical protein